MISLIVCSARPHMFEEFKKNVEQTIGVEHEIILFDNREKHWGLCKVYNNCVHEAKYPYLCFVHEDMYFFTKGWGQILINFYSQTPKCGIIGFAGSNYVGRTFVQWKVDRTISRVHTCISSNKELPVDYDNIKRFYNSRNDFDPVIVIDGMFLFTSRAVCDNVMFDEKMLDDFHIYDTDFSFSVSLKYNNYVCSKIDNMHRCRSKFSRAYVDGLLAFHKKRQMILPQSLVNLNTLHSWLIRNHEIIEFSDTLKNNSYSVKEYEALMRRFDPNCHVNVLLRCVDFIYGKLFNVKIRRLRCLKD